MPLGRRPVDVVAGRRLVTDGLDRASGVRRSCETACEERGAELVRRRDRRRPLAASRLELADARAPPRARAAKASSDALVARPRAAGPPARARGLRRGRRSSSRPSGSSGSGSPAAPPRASSRSRRGASTGRAARVRARGASAVEERRRRAPSPASRDRAPRPRRARALPSAAPARRERDEAR